jgi:hypothetical protein
MTGAAKCLKPLLDPTTSTSLSSVSNAVCASVGMAWPGASASSAVAISRGSSARSSKLNSTEALLLNVTAATRTPSSAMTPAMSRTTADARCCIASVLAQAFCSVSDVDPEVSMTKTKSARVSMQPLVVVVVVDTGVVVASSPVHPIRNTAPDLEHPIWNTRFGTPDLERQTI